ncbi:hypothetical protein DL546_000219 [Coniochaeta pulveracea]|uniref:Uncharacterized protein n=1 Tax=Coniochaeta pulveracea TaxID=177199 RepID=A0A420Y8P4_9PEZI|nr:hypothetical protein DL546_000219 [Coniochaeta pulveracea]
MPGHHRAAIPSGSGAAITPIPGPTSSHDVVSSGSPAASQSQVVNTGQAITSSTVVLGTGLQARKKKGLVYPSYLDQFERDDLLQLQLWKPPVKVTGKTKFVPHHWANAYPPGPYVTRPPQACPVPNSVLELLSSGRR